MCICEQGDGKTSLLRWDGFDCSKKIYNIARPKNNKDLTNVSATLFPAPGISSLLGAILPPVTVLLAIMAVVVSRLYTAYANAKALRISNLNSTLAQASGLEPIQE